MAMPGRHANHKRRQRHAAVHRQIREQERRGVRLGIAEMAKVEPVIAHDPAHEHGCLRCFVAKLDGGRR
jgi:hypothetical protein